MSTIPVKKSMTRAEINIKVNQMLVIIKEQLQLLDIKVSSLTVNSLSAEIDDIGYFKVKLKVKEELLIIAIPVLWFNKNETDVVDTNGLIIRYRTNIIKPIVDMPTISSTSYSLIEETMSFLLALYRVDVVDNRDLTAKPLSSLNIH